MPGALVDYVVVVPDQRQTYDTAFDPAYAGLVRRPDADFTSVPLDIRKSIARRGAMELFPGAVVNLGFGVSNGISAVAAEEGFYKELTLTVEGAEQPFRSVKTAKVGKNGSAEVVFDAMTIPFTEILNLKVEARAGDRSDAHASAIQVRPWGLEFASHSGGITDGTAGAKLKLPVGVSVRSTSS